MKIFKIVYKNPKVSIVIIAITVFFVISSSLQLFTNAYSSDYIAPDSYTYITASSILYNGLDPHHSRTMGYSALAGLPHVVFSEPTLNQMISWNYFLNFNLWLMTIITLFAALRLHLNKKSSFLLTLFFIFCIGNIGLISDILTETLACLLITLIGYQLLYFHKRKAGLNLAYAVALMNFLVLVRPGMIYMTVIFNSIFFVYIIKYKVLLFLKVILPVAFTILMIFIQASLIYKAHGNFTISYIDKYTWYLYLGAQSSADAKNISFPSKERDIRNNIMNPLSYKERYELANMDLVKQLKSHPKLIFSNFVNNILGNIVVGNMRIAIAEDYSKVPYFNHIRYYLYLISKAQNILFSFLGLFLTLLFLIRYRLLSLPLLMSIAIICYIIITSGISFWQGDRFHLVFYPLLLIVLSYFLANYKWFNKSKLL